MRTVAIVQARMGSERLPGKVMLEAAGKPLIVHMLERVYRATTIDDVVLAVPEGPQSEPLVSLPIYHDLPDLAVYRGPEEDVLTRVVGAADTYGASVIVELTGDCPLIDPLVIDRAVRSYVRPGRVDLVSTSRDSFSESARWLAYPRGMDVRVFSRATLHDVDGLASDPADREHVSLYMWEHQDRFACYNLVALAGLCDDVRLTVDTREDYELVRAILDALYPANPRFGLEEILALLATNPELRRINAHVQQRAVR